MEQGFSGLSPRGYPGGSRGCPRLRGGILSELALVGTPEGDPLGQGPFSAAGCLVVVFSRPAIEGFLSSDAGG